MVKKINDEKIMSFLRIAEAYPDNYILVRITEINNSTGKETGIALYTGESYGELAEHARNNKIRNETIVVHGENMIPILAGIL